MAESDYYRSRGDRVGWYLFRYVTGMVVVVENDGLVFSLSESLAAVMAPLPANDVAPSLYC